MTRLLATVLLCLICRVSTAAVDDAPLKQHSAFYPASRTERIRQNLQQHPDGTRLRAEALAAADFWLKLSDDEIWSLVFGPSISRSWMVWSNGECPACTNSVTMYNWQIEAQKHPWKVKCPHCKEFFPKNDFGAFYRSGLNEQGWFDPKRADRSLLINPEHSDPVGVDDGEGFVQGSKRWRFIGAYLVYGQFKQLIRDGIQKLAVAFVCSGDPVYAHKAGILLDRLADVYPEFNYAQQGYVYETRGHNGYVSTWHDACEETREIVLAYDQVFEGLRHDSNLVAFLSAKAARHKLSNPKSSFTLIQGNIEGRILRDALASTQKMHSNFPRKEIAYTVIQSVLGWPENRQVVENYMDGFLKRATAVDGVTGEKGLSGYASYTISGLADLLAEFARADAEFLPALLKRNSALRQTWRFHIDTHCLDEFYPTSGDCGGFEVATPQYVGANFAKLDNLRLQPSMFTFFWQMYQATGDPAYVQVLHRENADSTNGLPHDLFVSDPEQIREGVLKVIKDHGLRPELGSVHKADWHIGILRSGSGEHARALWLDYDSGGGHGHLDAMTLGLFARKRDWLPDFGYPPVQLGGWTTPQVSWYLSTPAHNSVTVDKTSQTAGAGRCTLWADGQSFHAMRASAPALARVQEFERTAVLVDVSPEEFYVVDLFRIKGGRDHARFIHGPKGTIETSRLQLQPASDYGAGTFMRNFRCDITPPMGWQAEWRPIAAEGRESVSMRYTDFSFDVQASVAEASVMPYKNADPNGFTIPSLMIRRQGTNAPLESVFCGLLEIAGKQKTIHECVAGKVLHADQVCTNGCVALQVRLQSGDVDLFFAASSDHSQQGMVVEWKEGHSTFRGELAFVRLRREKPANVSLCRGELLHHGNLFMTAERESELLEVRFTGSNARVLSGQTTDLKEIRGYKIVNQ